MGLDTVKTELSAQYVDHNLIQTDNKNPDDHLFLRAPASASASGTRARATASATRSTWSASDVPAPRCWARTATPAPPGPWACWPSAPAGWRWLWPWPASPSTSRCPRSGASSSSASCPTGSAPRTSSWRCCAATTSSGGVGRVIEYYGPGLEGLSAMDRHVIANMGAELGATTTVFPSDERGARVSAQAGPRGRLVRARRRRGRELRRPRRDRSEPARAAHRHALSPGNVRPVREVAGPRRSTRLHRLLGQPRLARLRRGRRDRQGAAGRRPRLLRRQPDLAPDLCNLVRDRHLLS